MGKKSRRHKKRKKRVHRKLLFHPFVLPLVLIGLLIGANLFLQLIRKPTELLAFLPISSTQLPQETWAAYGTDFLNNSTEITTPDFLAALAQAESGGNAMASPQWKWRWSRLSEDITRIYSPASSSVGLYQFTDGTFDLAKSFCIRDGQVQTIGPWHDWNSCWFNWLYSRLWPSHSIEMASAYLTHLTYKVMRDSGIHRLSLKHKQRLAAIIHLCGPGKGHRYIRKGLSLSAVGPCGSHSSRRYVLKIERLKRRFQAYLPSDHPDLLATN